MPSLSQSPKYRRFIEERDRALERILDKYQKALSEQVDFIKSQVTDLITASHARGEINMGYMGIRAKEGLYQKIDFVFKMASHSSFELFRRMRTSVYVLSHAGEAEAIGRALGKNTKIHIDEPKLTKVINDPSVGGGPLKARLELYYARLKREVFNALDLCFVMEDEALGDVISRMEKAFPPSKLVKRRPRELKPVQVREADTTRTPLVGRTSGQKSLVSGYVDAASWDDMVDDYSSDYLPPDMIRRAPKDKVRMPDESVQYQWEIESEVNEDFVKQVRNGQHDAARENGVRDLMWIAIIDDRTDDCCRWRDGLTSSQIEKELNGPHSDDECEATIPPAHFNCRCTMAPVTDEMPDDQRLDYEDLNSWLNT